MISFIVASLIKALTYQSMLSKLSTSNKQSNSSSKATQGSKATQASNSGEPSTSFNVNQIRSLEIPVSLVEFTRNNHFLERKYTEQQSRLKNAEMFLESSCLIQKTFGNM